MKQSASCARPSTGVRQPWAHVQLFSLVLLIAVFFGVLAGADVRDAAATANSRRGSAVL